MRGDQKKKKEITHPILEQHKREPGRLTAPAWLHIAAVSNCSRHSSVFLGAKRSDSPEGYAP